MSCHFHHLISLPFLALESYWNPKCMLNYTQMKDSFSFVLLGGNPAIKERVSSYWRIEGEPPEPRNTASLSFLSLKVLTHQVSTTLCLTSSIANLKTQRKLSHSLFNLLHSLSSSLLSQSYLKTSNSTNSCSFFHQIVNPNSFSSKITKPMLYLFYDLCQAIFMLFFFYTLL